MNYAFYRAHPEEFAKYKQKDLVPLVCAECKKEFSKSKRIIRHAVLYRLHIEAYCTAECMAKSQYTSITKACGNCGKETTKTKAVAESSKSGHIFCNSSCSATYANTHKTKGTRVSKLEVYLQEQLKTLYPDLEIHFNRKDAIDSELDIYIPSMKLAFELNGIFHYEPIYGQDKLKQIQNNDSRKFQACIERGISLCIIDTSTLSYFKPAKAERYLNIVVGCIKSHSAMV